MPLDQLAANLRAARLRAKLSQVEAAERAGIRRATWSQLENGRHNPTLDLLEQVAAAVNTTVARLLRKR
jgi:transcriptional regulator with XRE-family HTH domain